MPTHTWDHDRAQKRIDKEIEKVKEVEIRSYVKDMDLENIPTNAAYRVFGTHLYADIVNISEILETTDTEGETCHKRTLRFLNQHYRAVQRILNRCDAKRVDFHGQRLHCLVAKPYDSEKDAEAKRIRRAVAIAQLIIDVLKETGDDDEKIPNAKVCVGIDSGEALAVNNGRRGGREPLFLGALRIPSHAGHRFRRKPATHSERCRPLIPTHAGHPFRQGPATLGARDAG